MLFQIPITNTNIITHTKHSINSYCHWTVQIKQSVQRDMSPSTDLNSELSLLWYYHHFFPLPRYYYDICPRYRHYHGKIIYIVLSTLSCYYLCPHYRGALYSSAMFRSSGKSGP